MCFVGWRFQKCSSAELVYQECQSDTGIWVTGVELGGLGLNTLALDGSIYIYGSG